MADFGFKKSVITGDEIIFSANGNVEVPKKYSFKKYMPKVLDQGANPICVPCSISAFLNWRENLSDGSRKDNKVDYFQIYDCKTTEGEGMTFKEAFHFLRHEGVKSKSGVLNVGEYAMVNNLPLLKVALLTNGPCVGALPVYNYTSEFWNKNMGDNILGYHAISIVGYDNEGFIIRNSWGESFGKDGYTKIKYDDANGKFVEIWTILS